MLAVTADKRSGNLPEVPTVATVAHSLARSVDYVRTVPLDEPWARRRLVVGTRRGRALSVAARNFVEQLTSRLG